MNTKQRILDEALTLFAEHGYANVFVGQIAEAVGIKAPSLYKHYKSKQAIFEAILSEMQTRYEQQAGMLGMNGGDSQMDASFFGGLSEDALVQTGLSLFVYFLHDDYVRRFRKMLTVEQFHDPELGKLYMAQYVDGPLSYQGAMFGLLTSAGLLKGEEPSVMALQFYAPIYLCLTICDGDESREEQALEMIEKHIRIFSQMYTRGN